MHKVVAEPASKRSRRSDAVRVRVLEHPLSGAATASIARPAAMYSAVRPISSVAKGQRRRLLLGLRLFRMRLRCKIQAQREM